MSETPLFQNTDEQEAAYAPQQLPTGVSERTAAELEDGDQGGNTAVDSAIVPAAGAGLVGQAGAGFNTAAVGGEVGAAGPAVAATALASDADDDITGRDRT